MIFVTQIPFLFTLYYSTLSWNLVRPGSRQFVGLNNYVAVVQDSQFWRVALNTVVLIVVVVLVSALLGLLIALLLDRAFLGRGVVRTLLITPFLITPVAGALIWKTTILDPTNGIVVRDEHVVLGWGRDFGDVTPLRGVILGGGEQKLSVEVELQEIAAPA